MSVEGLLAQSWEPFLWPLISICDSRVGEPASSRARRAPGTPLAGPGGVGPSEQARQGGGADDARRG
eukprot:5468223-Alexandrium_andersonii.AAC.1